MYENRYKQSHSDDDTVWTKKKHVACETLKRSLSCKNTAAFKSLQKSEHFKTVRMFWGIFRFHISNIKTNF